MVACICARARILSERAMQEAGKRKEQARFSFEGKSRRGARITRDRETRGGLGPGGGGGHRLEKGIGLRGGDVWRGGKRWKIPATPRLICSSAHLYVSSPSPSSPPLPPPSSRSRDIFFWGSRIARARVFVIPTCFMLLRAVLYLHVAMHRYRTTRTIETGGGGKGEEVGGDHPGIASAFLIRAFPHTMISFSFFLRIRIIFELFPSLSLSLSI